MCSLNQPVDWHCDMIHEPPQNIFSDQCWMVIDQINDRDIQIMRRTLTVDGHYKLWKLNIGQREKVERRRRDKNITIWTNIEKLRGIETFLSGQISQLLSKHLELKENIWYLFHLLEFIARDFSLNFFHFCNFFSSNNCIKNLITK